MLIETEDVLSSVSTEDLSSVSTEELSFGAMSFYLTMVDKFPWNSSTAAGNTDTPWEESLAHRSYPASSDTKSSGIVNRRKAKQPVSG